MGRKRIVAATEVASRGPLRPQIILSEMFRTQLRLKIANRAVKFDPSLDQWEELAQVLTRYDHLKAMRNRLPTKLAVEKVLRKIAATAANLANDVRAIAAEEPSVNESFRATAAMIEDQLKERWRFDLKPHGQRGHYEWELMDVASLLEELASSASAARPVSVSISPKDFGFTSLCRNTAAWWEVVTDKRATARKDDDKQKTGPSSFIVFLTDILKLIPEDTRPKFNSMSALAKAFSASRAK